MEVTLLPRDILTLMETMPKLVKDEEETEGPRKCDCAGLAYRNNLDTTRDYKIIGKSGCKICRGSGFITTCSICEGAGVFASKVCVNCTGRGKVRADNPGRWIKA